MLVLVTIEKKEVAQQKMRPLIMKHHSSALGAYSLFFFCSFFSAIRHAIDTTIHVIYVLYLRQPHFSTILMGHYVTYARATCSTCWANQFNQHISKLRILFHFWFNFICIACVETTGPTFGTRNTKYVFCLIQLECCFSLPAPMCSPVATSNYQQQLL